MLHALNIHTTGLTRETLKVQLAKELTIIDTDIDEILIKKILKHFIVKL